MRSDINYDFNLSKSVCDSLEETAKILNTEVIDTRDDNIDLLRTAWRSEASELFISKYQLFCSDVQKVRNEILCEAEKIKKTSQLLYIREQEAKKTVLRKEN